MLKDLEAMGYGKMIEENERQMRAAEKATKDMAAADGEAFLAERAAEPADALVAKVVEDDDRQLEPLLDGGDNLRVHHEIAAVALVVGQLDALALKQVYK